MSKSYLVTGGAGFIGSHLTEYLLAKGYKVFVLDNLYTGRWENLPDHPNLEKIEGDVLRKLDIEQIVGLNKIDYIFHLASAVGVKNIMDDPIGSMKTMLDGTKNVLEIAAKYGGIEVLVTSTSEVYGKSNEIPFREDSDVTYGPTVNHRWSYAYAKAIDEMMAINYAYEERLKGAKIVRLFNTVGPRQSPAYGMVLPRFIDKALNQKPLLVHGTGKQTRCFGHVKDVIRALYKISKEDACSGEVINIGSNEEISIENLANKVIQLTNSTSYVKYMEYHEVGRGRGFEDMQRRVPSIEKVYTLIGWSPTYTLDEIIKDTIQYRRSVLGLN